MEILEMLDSDSLQMDKAKLHRVYDYMNSKMVLDAKTPVTLDSVTALRYRGDMYGLLRNELEIPNSSILINIIVNGFKSSVEYDGREVIYLLDPEITERVLELTDEEN